jgi:formylglycine-generating enzyme required for sulfatase activity/serine/threonine protein kinase
MSHSPSFAPLAEGALFARDFRIVRPLSQGGMGAVYVATQLSTGRERALKLMHPRLVQDERQRRRFEQEAQVGARIESAHVVEVVGAGVDDDTGSPWLCMELLRGQDLASLIAQRGTLPPSEVLFVFRQVCHAVGAAHRVGVVHRDLKPENVFLATSRQADAPFVVKVLDFGIAKLVADGEKHDTAAVGTPLWMAPEQTEAGATIGPATDVWALGLIAFRLLTGRHYWKGASDASASAVTLLREIAIEPLPEATVRASALGGVTPPPGFDAWFARCVARAIDARFVDATAAFAALAPILGGEARTDTPAPPTREPTDGDGRVPSLEGVSNTQDPERRSAPARISGLEATEPMLPTASQPRIEAPVEEPASSATPSKVMAQRSGGGVWVVAGGIVLALGIGGFLAWRWQIKAELAEREATEKRQREEEEARVLTEEKLRLAERRAELDNQLGKMVRIPTSTFEMGSDDYDNDEKPVTRVTVPAFEIDLREVSTISFAACVKLGKCEPAGTGPGCNATIEARAADPANCIYASQAEAFCKFAGKRLPREEEWEVAARGGQAGPFPWGPAAPAASDACWARLDPDKQRDEGTCKVGERGTPNTFGLVDVVGNVREWTSSPFCSYTRRDCESPSRVVRGGSFTDTDPDALRVTIRHKASPDTRPANIGFRCARDALY